MSKRQISGFTLVELMVVLAVLAILVAVAFPNFQGLIRSNRVTTASNEMLASLSLARTEGIRGTRGAGVCPSANGTSCGGWNDGWIVWQEIDGDAEFTAGTDRVVRYSQGKPHLAVTNAADAVLYDSRGRTIGGAQSFSVVPDEDTALARIVCIGVTGQARVTHGSCG
ncbi:MAG TPA: GspH/FimT family pseudopilin [Pseudoxanthomonas sp.]